MFIINEKLEKRSLQHVRFLHRFLVFLHIYCLAGSLFDYLTDRKENVKNKKN